MAQKKNQSNQTKTNFGKRKGGKPKKLKGPKESNKSKYRGQGR